ncbi:MULTISPECIES: PhoH family protein [unclassified Thiomonas]|uniref:PhoH family protein n=1 Tax=unclassified Thiomonas TaxID=2625466 RepID=UPI0004DBB55C|nr:MULTISPECIES: PhoH family protein [unclassified Thiomonas]MDD5001322.1 PhoH family protein [Thiomonas arsenitoxydans]CQR45258.1 putative Phosphate starvation-inducible protein PhoH [Thiomonas sp. CB3]CDW92286.1 putative Phosphate starvation-inducible protein PhoH [Thiomonas sp. CB2]VDY06557.1 putative Phosphate starvation-inducible protein PhoH [Thiomonas sp. Bio17B3]VDY10148.1 putative Phosphate starvation-inducible protein PhoH [Thiomonas sp. Sup16B3]
MPLPPPPKSMGSLLTQAAPSITQTPSASRKTTALDKAGPIPQETAPAVAVVSAATQPAASTRQTRQPISREADPTAADRPAQKAVQPKRAPIAQQPAKLFVLDTNVLLHDPMSLYRFEEHDIYLPMVTLEELDAHKKGLSEVARNGRQVSRELDALVADTGSGIDQGIALNRTGHAEAKGRLFFQTRAHDVELPIALPQGKADNQILAVLQDLTHIHTERPVVLVSKDINMRVKARALGLHAEDYANDKTLDDADLLYTGMMVLPPDFWDRQAKSVESWQQGGNTFYRVQGKFVAQMLVNQAVYWESGSAPPLYARVKEIRSNTAVLQVMRDHTHQKNAIWGVTARNREQNFALNLLMDPDVDFVTLAGQAGTGKTLLALAAGLSQVLDARRYNEIIVTRVTVPVGEDIGYLPGTEEEKMGPWMGALDDNLEVLNQSEGGNTGGEWGRAATQDLIRSKIKIKSMNFMRGRTFLNKYVIIDEAQNLTPKQMKTLITRAGPGTKLVCMGNIAQIDTPYLTEGSSGMTFVVDRFKGWGHSGHVTLARGERSRLADYASEVL